jgi:hypothetical protein
MQHDFAAEAQRLSGFCNFCSGTGRYLIRGNDWGDCYECNGRGRIGPP